MNRAIYKGKIAEIWEIGKDTERPDWVQQAIDLNYICWMDNHVRILMAGLKTSVNHNMKLSLTASLGGGFAGYCMYVLGYEGDILDITNHRIISKKRFLKEYHILD